MAIICFPFMKKPGGQDVPLMLTAILLPIISPKRHFLKWQIYTIFFQKAFRAAKGCSPCQLPLKDVLRPSESQEIPVLTSAMHSRPVFA